MVWPFGSSQKGASEKDPYGELDPTLREFLDKESPLKYHTANPPSKPPKVATSPEPKSPNPPSPAPTSGPSHNQSLYADGRYDHLWRTYRPKAVVDAEGRSDQEKLNDVLAAYKQRRQSISGAAMENCADVRWKQQECIIGGTWKQRVEMCRHETRALDRCFRMNARFLKALGYLSTWDRPPEEEERIQMHADKLFQRWQAQERLVAEAKKEGKPPPVFEPLLTPEVSVNSAEGAKAPATTTPLEMAQLREDQKEKLEKKLKGQSPEERYYEERAYAAEIRAGLQTAEQWDKATQEVKQGKQERRARGDATLGDRISGWFGW